MNEIVAYPPSRPRLVATSRGKSWASPYVAAGSKRARTRWQLGQSRALSGLLWRPPTQDVARAWNAGIDFLDGSEQTTIGVLSDPGPEQRLTLIPVRGDIVVKIAVHPEGDAVLEREALNLMRLSDSAWHGLGPRLHGEGLHQSDRTVLLMERIVGRHPHWAELTVHARLAESLASPDGDAVHHGDVTPWNVVEAPGGSLVLVDWEFADLSRGDHPACAIVDFILRGAAVERVRPARVRPVLEAALELTGAAGFSFKELLEVHDAYRRRAHDAFLFERTDDLSQRARDLLIRSLAGGTGVR